MSEHPIDGLMETAMNSIKDMVDVNTIIGDPIETSNGMVIIPISKVSFGFAAGGSEFKGETIDEYKKKDKEEEVQYRLPFGGGSGAGISINPVAFVIVLKDSIKVMPIEHSSVIDKLMDYVPDLMQKSNDIIDNKSNNSKKSENENFIPNQDKEKNKDESINQTQSDELNSNIKPKIKNPVKSKEKLIKKIRNIPKEEKSEIEVEEIVEDE